MRTEYFTTQEAARLLGYDDSHVRRLILMGKLEAIKWGDRQWMIKSEDVRKLLKKRKQQASKKNSK